MNQDNPEKKIDFSSGDVISSDSSIPRFTIDDLEKAINLFRKEGSEPELQAFIHEITNEIKDKKIKEQEPKVLFEEENTLFELKKSIKNVLNQKKIKEKTKKAYKNKYFKHVSVIAGIFFVVYLAFNIPIYYSRVSWAFIDKTEFKTIKYTELEQKPTAKSAALEPGEVIPVGSRIVIPKIGVNSPIVTVNSFEEADIQAGLKNGVVRLGKMSSPGEPGNTFITGHSSNYWWDKGKYNYVFVLLDKLQTGENLKVYDNGNKFVYEVVAKKIVDPSDTSSIVHSSEPTLTLMTCYPPGSTSKRLLVSLRQVSPKYHAPEMVEKEKLIEIPKILPKNDRNSFWDAFKALVWR